MWSFVTRERLEQILQAKQLNAAMRTIPFGLTVDNVLWPEVCPVLGLRLDYFIRGRGKLSEYSPSLDRIDPALGYYPENVRVISNRANRIKNDGTAEEHRKIAAYIDENLPA